MHLNLKVIHFNWKCLVLIFDKCVYKEKISSNGWESVPVFFSSFSLHQSIESEYTYSAENSKQAIVDDASRHAQASVYSNRHGIAIVIKTENRIPMTHSSKSEAQDTKRGKTFLHSFSFPILCWGNRHSRIVSPRSAREGQILPCSYIEHDVTDFITSIGFPFNCCTRYRLMFLKIRCVGMSSS